MSSATKSMDGKVCLVTGATSGIGAATAQGLAAAGATVMVVGRSSSKCAATVHGIREQTGSLAVEFVVADFSSLAEIRRLAWEVQERHDRLDVLVNNAGVLSMTRQTSADGFESTFAINHLAHFLLTNLLLDRLRASGPARVVTVSSDAHSAMRAIDFDDLQGEKRFNGVRAYCLSKVANVLFTFELARRLADTGVTANCLHPGFVATNIFAGNGWLGWISRRLASVFALRPEKGARTSIYLATAPELAGVTGRYYERRKEAKSSPLSHDEAVAKRLWDLSAQMTGLST